METGGAGACVFAKDQYDQLLQFLSRNKSSNSTHENAGANTAGTSDLQDDIGSLIDNELQSDRGETGPTFSLLEDESEYVCDGSVNPSRGESNLGHANVAPDVRVLSDEVDENTKQKGKEKIAEHCSGDENASKKRKYVADTPNPPCESIPQTTSETVRQNPHELVGGESDMKTKVLDMSYFHLVETGDFNGYPWGIDVFMQHLNRAPTSLR
ncbi:hypothetical protein HAX54_047580 [Datura stramonium]|uniref:Uncharacterized protein n=1 Tax=Datura stramonium TaxID=4076 RepID=A0ABS8ST60_DATST|nr:hypothetical protein [Datura stramonium]